MEKYQLTVKGDFGTGNLIDLSMDELLEEIQYWLSRDDVDKVESSSWEDIEV